MLKSHKKTVVEALGRSPIHPFPARMAPGIALEALSGGKTKLRVLDPMAGSGTVLAVAREEGHQAFGVDIDPLAVLLTRVWTRTIDAKRVVDTAADVLRRAKWTCEWLPSSLAYPEGSDEETRQFIRYWFDAYARSQLAALSFAISSVTHKSTREALWCAFSRLIITKSSGASLAMDLSHSRPHRGFSTAPVKPFNRFISAVEVVVANCPQSTSILQGPPTKVEQGDARKLRIETGSIDLVLTSPPYLNAIDYMRCSKFSLVWMGYNVEELRQIRSESVGSEASFKRALDSQDVRSLISSLRLKPALSDRHHALLARYVWDMGRALDEVDRVLTGNGRAVYVVGDSTVRGTFIPNSSIIIAAAKTRGMKLRSRHSRTLPANRRYLPPPKREASFATMDTRMRKEVVLVFEKSPN